MGFFVKLIYNKMLPKLNAVYLHVLQISISPHAFNSHLKLQSVKVLKNMRFLKKNI